MYFSKQSRNEGKARDVRCDKKAISGNTYKRWYVYRGFAEMMSTVTSL